MTRKTALTNVRVFDGNSLSKPETVVIDGAVIGTDPSGAEVIDADGAVLLPGFIDAHIHLTNEDDLRAMRDFGITTALDMACWPPEKLNSLRGVPGLTDIRSAGTPATAPGSAHTKLLDLPPEALVVGAEQAKRFVADRVREGSDYIKVIADIPGPDQITLDTIVAAAHENGKQVVAHAAALEPYRMALAAQADMVTHVPLDDPLDEAAIALMAGRIAIPTLVMMEGIARVAGRNYQAAKDSVTALHRAGVTILAGTDANNVPGAPALSVHGESLHQELALFVAAGLSTVDALRAATILPAEEFGLLDRGVIAPGMRADLVLIDGDPIADIHATRNIRTVWCAGLCPK